MTAAQTGEYITVMVSGHAVRCALRTRETGQAHGVVADVMHGGVAIHTTRVYPFGMDHQARDGAREWARKTL